MTVKSYTHFYIQDDWSNTCIVIVDSGECVVFSLYGNPNDEGMSDMEHQFVVDTPEKYERLWDYLSSEQTITEEK